MSTALARVITFQPAGPFHADVRSRVEAYFRESGRSQRGGWRLGVKSVAILAWFGASYGLLLLGHPSAWMATLLAVSLGLAWAGLGFNVMHDANHGSSASRTGWNRALAFSSDLIGASSALWRQKHNVLHHTYTNVVGVDADLDSGTLLRLAPSQPLRPGHRWQHLYAWPLYAAFPIRWFFFDDYRDLVTGRIGEQPFQRPRGWDLAALFAGKLLFMTWAVALPVALHPTWWILPAALLTIGTLGVTLATTFQLAHAVGEATFIEPSGGPLPTDWATHQVRTTVDFARGNGWLGWYLGGLNFQVVHHLFPRVSHVHYRALAPLVEAACRDHGLSYRAWPSLQAALAANLEWLRRMGLPAASWRPRMIRRPGGTSPSRPRGPGHRCLRSARSWPGWRGRSSGRRA
jgi:linoleoyl-CoA desaturase